jgi:hypothetical protein
MPACIGTADKQCHDKTHSTSNKNFQSARPFYCQVYGFKHKAGADAVVTLQCLE